MQHVLVYAHSRSRIPHSPLLRVPGMMVRMASIGLSFSSWTRLTQTKRRTWGRDGCGSLSLILITVFCHRPCVRCLAQRLCISQDDTAPSQWASKRKTGGLLDGRMGRWWMGTRCVASRHGIALLILRAARFLFRCGHWCPLRLSCWPQQAFSTRKFAPSATSLQDPKVWSLPSGQDVLARRLSRRPAGLTFALVCVALRHRAAFALTLSCRCLDFGFGFCPRSGTLALALS